MKRKRILPIILAVCLVAGAGVVVARADNPFGIDRAANPILSGDSYESLRLVAGSSAPVYLNPGMFVQGGEPAIERLEPERLRLVVSGGDGRFASLFGEPAYQVSGNAVAMRLPVRDGVYEIDVPFDCYLSFEYHDPSGVSASSAFRFAGIVQANTQAAAQPAAYGSDFVAAPAGSPTGYQITGWSPVQAGARFAQQTAPGAWMQYGTLAAATLFQYTGSGLPYALNDELVNTYGLAARSTSSNITARLQRYAADDYRVYLETAPNTPAGVHYVDIELYSANGALSGSFLYSMLEMTVTGTGASSSTAASGRITGINPNAQLGDTANGIWGAAEKNGRWLPDGNESLDSLWIRPGDEVLLHFDSDFFQWEGDAPSPPTTAVTIGTLRRGNVAVKALNGRYNHLIDTLEIRYRDGRAYVYLRFVDRFISTKDIDFELDIVLTQKGRYVKGTEAYLFGTIYNDFTEAYDGMDYIDLSDGEVVEATDTIRDIEVLLGEGVSVYTRLVKGRTYYGVATLNKLDADDEKVFAEHDDVVAVYELATIGLSSKEKNVKIDSPQEYYVYNRYLEYVGTTRDMLPYSTKYYMAVKQLRTGSADDDANEAEPELYTYYESAVPTAATPGPTGGNRNNNPNTGR